MLDYIILKIALEKHNKTIQMSKAVISIRLETMPNGNLTNS